MENATNYWLLPNAIRNLLRVYLKEILGGNKEYITGEKAVKDLRISQKAKEKLISDYERCNFPKNSENKAWEKIFRSAETHVPITFLPEAANDERNVVLITLAHPFVDKELIVGCFFKGISGMMVEDSKRNLSAARSQMHSANVVHT